MSTRDVLLAVDAGTTNIKAVAFGTDGTELAAARRETETLRPAPGHVEQDPSAVWEATAGTLREVVAGLPDGAEPLGVGLTGQGDGLWAVADDGTPVGNAILWSDSRAADIIAEWDEGGQLEEIVARCGSTPYPGMSLPLLSWLAREDPERFDRVGTVLSCKDWLAYRLTGERTLDHSEATVPYLEKTTDGYDRSVFDVVDLPDAATVLPTLSAPTEVVGTVTGEAADATGLEEGLPVVSGPFDVPASAIGSGAASAGEGAVTLGTSLTHQVFLEGPRPAPSGIGMALGIEGLWTCAIGSNAGTPSLEWAADTIVGDREVAALEDVAAGAPVGSDGVLYHPYLHTAGERGPFVDPTARAQFVGLSPEHDTEHLVRAVHEGLSLAVRDCVEHLPEDPAPVALSGGGASSELWCQLIADCLDRPAVVPAGSEAGARGAAIVLGLAIGEFPSLAAAIERTVSTDRRYEPREHVAPQYARLYDLFVDVRETMASVWASRTETFEEMDR